MCRWNRQSENKFSCCKVLINQKYHNMVWEQKVNGPAFRPCTDSVLKTIKKDSAIGSKRQAINFSLESSIVTRLREQCIRFTNCVLKSSLPSDWAIWAIKSEAFMWAECLERCFKSRNVIKNMNILHNFIVWFSIYFLTHTVQYFVESKLCFYKMARHGGPY